MVGVSVTPLKSFHLSDDASRTSPVWFATPVLWLATNPKSKMFVVLSFAIDRSASSKATFWVSIVVVVPLTIKLPLITTF